MIRLLITLLLLSSSVSAQFKSFVTYYSAKFPRNSESDLVFLPSGSIICFYTRFYFGYLDNNNADIVMKISRDGGKNWSDYGVAMPNIGQQGTMVASCLYENDTIKLFFAIKNSNTDCKPYRTYSADSGRTWTAPVALTATPGYFTLNNDRVTRLSNGRLVAPVAFITDIGNYGSVQLKSSVLYSDDNANSWAQSNQVTVIPQLTAGMQEPGVVELSPGNLLMYARVQQGTAGSGYQWLSMSTNNGTTWGTPYQSALISPLAPAKIIKLSDGRLLAAHCMSFNGRAPLVLSISSNNGSTWTKVYDVATSPGRDFTYPSMVERSGYIYITHYEQLRAKPLYSIVFHKIPISELN